MCRSTQPLHGILENRLFRWHRYAISTLLMIAATSLLQYTTLPAYAQYEDSDAGYIDSAVISNKLRVRFDAGFDLNRPDRAEFFYASWANLADHPHAIKNTDKIVTAVNNRGPLRIPESVNFQEVSTYLEMAPLDRFSIFAELPFRFVQFIGDAEDPNAFETPGFREAYDRSSSETQGVSDTQLGFKYALVQNPIASITFQFRTYIPTGRSQLGLGTGHVSTEPGMLMQFNPTDRFSLMGQAKLWTSINGGANAGNIATYGTGMGYDLFDPSGPWQPFGGFNFRVTPLAEFVGWTVLDGFETLSSPDSLPIVPNTARIPVDPIVTDASGLHQTQDPPGSGGRPAPVTHGVEIATGKTIVNMKLGFRTHFSPQDSVYIGWGRALTGSRWYQDFARIEYRFLF